MQASLRRIWGLMYRHLCLYRRSWPRLVELAYWPILQMCIWGFTARFISAQALSAHGLLHGTGHGLVMVGSTMLGGVLLWEITIRSQMGVAVSFLEEIWSRNLGHIFISPLRPWELLAGLIGVAIARVMAGVLPGHCRRLSALCLQSLHARPGAGTVLRQSHDHGLGLGAGHRLAHPAPRRGRRGPGLVAALRPDAARRRLLPRLRLARLAATRSPRPSPPRMSSKACAISYSKVMFPPWNCWLPSASMPCGCSSPACSSPASSALPAVRGALITIGE